MYLVEQSVQKIRRLIASEKAAVVDQSGELQHDLIPVGDAGDDRLRVTAAKPTRQIRQRRVGVLVLGRRDERHERNQQCDLAPESHGCLLCIG